jgi:MFS family permease
MPEQPVPRAAKLDVVLLSVGFCLGMTVMFANLSVATVFAKELLEDRGQDGSMATLPMALLIGSIAVTSITRPQIARRLGGFKRAYVCFAVLQLLACAVGFLATRVADASASLAVLSLSMVGTGFTSGFVNHFRFAAQEVVPARLGAIAASSVVAGAILAAVLSGELVKRTRDALAPRFGATFLALAACAAAFIATTLALRLVPWSARVAGVHGAAPNQDTEIPKAVRPSSTEMVAARSVPAPPPALVSHVAAQSSMEDDDECYSDDWHTAVSLATVPTIDVDVVVVVGGGGGGGGDQEAAGETGASGDSANHEDGSTNIAAPHAAARPGLAALLLAPPVANAVITATIAYASMVSVMLGVPLEMDRLGFEFNDIADVISAHVLGMFVPSLVTGVIIKKLGVLRVVNIGIAVQLTATMITIWGRSKPWFIASLTLVGVGWNWCFIGGTVLLQMHLIPAERARTQAANDAVVFATTTVFAAFTGVIAVKGSWVALLVTNASLIGLAWLKVIHFSIKK